jgi:hypothetical protein
VEIGLISVSGIEAPDPIGAPLRERQLAGQVCHCEGKAEAAEGSASLELKRLQPEKPKK